jgi:phage tail sheath protein FI
MPGTYSYPGVYVEEIPSGIRPITGVSTSNTAFVGFFAEGPMNEPVRITSFADFERRFGGLDRRSETSYAIRQFYLNGGQVAWVVRVAASTPLPAVAELHGGSPLGVALRIEAASPGAWGQRLQVGVSHRGLPGDHFDLVIRELATVGGRRRVIGSEIHRNLDLDTTSRRFVPKVLAAESPWVRATSVGAGAAPVETGDVTAPAVISDAASEAFESLGPDPQDPNRTPNDGQPPGGAELLAGMKTLDSIAPDIFNILCLPRAASLPPPAMIQVYTEAQKYCEDRRAFLIVDIPEGTRTPAHLVDDWMNDVGANLRHTNAAVYYPRMELRDPLDEYRARNVGASGTMAGVYARTDSTRGVWKAPAGTEAALRGVTVTRKLTDLENGGINPFGLNVLRTFPIHGDVAWGARTLEGADQQASEWKYIPVRRTALFIEESLYQALKWVVFEPNDEPLWSQIRLNVGAFMQTLFRQGAFQGATPREAYLVKCDRETTTQEDIDRGVVNILVGFAPLKPAEFVVIRIQQMAGQTQS